MSEIEKLYKNAGFQKKQCKDYSCTVCDKYNKCEKYPPFTAEKQLSLIKWLMNYPMLDEISLFFNEPSKTFNLRVYSLPEIGDFRSTYTETQNNFEDMLCGLINNLWQDLTEEEKQQIKEILE